MSKKDNKEQEILLAAEKMFAEKGFKGGNHHVDCGRSWSDSCDAPLLL